MCLLIASSSAPKHFLEVAGSLFPPRSSPGSLTNSVLASERLCAFHLGSVTLRREVVQRHSLPHGFWASAHVVPFSPVLLGHGVLGALRPLDL